MKVVNTREEIGLLSFMIHCGHTENLQDHSWNVSLSPSLRQSVPSPHGSGIQSLVGNQEAQHGFERAGMKRFLDLNEMEELRNDAYNNSNIAKQRLKRWHDQLVSQRIPEGQRVFCMTLSSTSSGKAEVKVDRSFYYSTSAFKWSSGTTQFQQQEFQSQWPSSQAIRGAFFSRQGGNHPP
ncbi:hypothetical protein CK203_109808 [Vitis vinifera]|uniref:Uncharacterized protein n=1 Tax=Vitis vinifera TaxID=29760 RepID=A0A438FE24_VITVI|nr:hypothetical protein CK203_109808 [Vitis vinifera]